MRGDTDPDMLGALMSYWPTKCLSHKGNNDRWPGKKTPVTQNLTKGFKGVSFMPITLFFSKNELGDVWASHEEVWRTTVVHCVNRAPNTPFKDPSAVTSGKWDLAKPWDIVVSSVSCDCWNVPSAYWESTWKCHRVDSQCCSFLRQDLT